MPSDLSTDLPLPGLAFVAAPLDRAADVRRDPERLRALLAHEDSQLLWLREGNPLVSEEEGQPALPDSVCWLGPAALGLTPKRAEWVFLGLAPDGRAFFASEVGRAFDLGETALAGSARFQDLRSLLPRLSAADASVLGTAKAITDWRARHRHCSVCGTPTEAREGGWKTSCPECGAEHFPRTDPVAIMLAVSGDLCLLGRQARWPKGMFSCLAGFIEPGETIEDGCRRELFEEAGVRAGAVRYMFNQPWPFPSSLMIGLIAEVEDRSLKLDPTELEAAAWFSRADACRMLAGTLPGHWCPPPFAIAHHLLRAWTEADT